MKNLSPKQIICLVLMAVLIVVFFVMGSSIKRPDAYSQASKKPAQTTSQDAQTQASKKGTPQTAQAQKAPEGSYVDIAFTFNRSSAKKGSDQFAAWVEDKDGNFVRTIVVTQYAARKGTAKYAFCLPTWGERSGARANAKAIDVAAGATPQAGTIHYYWDLTDKNNTPVKPGTYRIFLEGTQSQDEQILFQADIALGSDGVTITPQPTYITGKVPDQPMLATTSFTYKP